MSRRSLFTIVTCLSLVACSKTEGAEASISSTGTTSSTDTTAPSLSEIANANKEEVLDHWRQLLEDVSDVMSKVTDESSAQAAAPALEQLGQLVTPLIERRDEVLGAGGEVENKLALAQSTMGMLGEMNRLTSQFERLEAIPGVREVLEDPMTKIMELFDSNR